MRKALVAILLLLVAGVIVADRWGVGRVEDEIAKQVAAEYRLDRKPDVTIHGFPFLTQAIDGEYDQIDVALGEWTERGVTVRDARLELMGVRAPLTDVINGNSAQIRARTATASAIVPYSVVRKYAPTGVKDISASGSDLQAQVTGSFAGFSVSGNLVVALQATSRGIVVTPRSIGGGGIQLPLSTLRQQYTFTVPVHDLLPLGAQVSEIEVTPEGLRIMVTVDDVKFQNLSFA